MKNLFTAYPYQKIILTSGWSIIWHTLEDIEPKDFKNDTENEIWTNLRSGISLFNYTLSKSQILQLYINWTWIDEKCMNGYFELELAVIIEETYEKAIILETISKQELVEEFHKIVFYTSDYFINSNATIENYVASVKSKKYKNIKYPHYSNLYPIAFKNGGTIEYNSLYKHIVNEIKILGLEEDIFKETLFKIKDIPHRRYETIIEAIYTRKDATNIFLIDFFQLNHITREKRNKQWVEKNEETKFKNYVDILEKLSSIHGDIDIEEPIFIGVLPPTQAFLEEYARKQATEKAVIVEKQRLHLLGSQYKLAQEVIVIETSKEIHLKEEITVSLVAYFLEKYSQEKVFYKIENVKTKVLEIKDLVSFENMEPFEIVLDGYVQHFPKGLKIVVPYKNIEIA